MDRGRLAWGGRASECGAKTGWTGLAAGGDGPQRGRAGAGVSAPFSSPVGRDGTGPGPGGRGDRRRRMAGGIALWGTSRARARARATWRAVGGAAGVMPRAAVMASAHRRCGPGTIPGPGRRRRSGAVVWWSWALGSLERDASGASRLPMIPQAAQRKPGSTPASRSGVIDRQVLPQPSTTYSSRGASLSAIGPSGPHTTMSSMRAPYSPTR